MPRKFLAGLGTWELALGASFVVAAAFIEIAHQYPATNDVSSHLATAVIADRLLDGDAFFAAHYIIEPNPVPYWATTVLLLPLLQVMNPMAALDVLFVLYFAALPLAYFWALRSGAPANVSMVVVSPLVAFNFAYWFGEINFLLGFPAVFASFALFLGLQEVRTIRFAMFCILTIATYLCHVYDLAALLIAIGSLATADLLRRRVAVAAAPAFVAAQWMALCWVGLLFATAAWFVLGAHGTGANRGTVLLGWNASRFLLTTMYPLETVIVDRRVAALFPLMLAALALVGYLRSGREERRELVNPAFLWPAIALLLVSYAGPSGVVEELGREIVGPRFAPLALLFALAAVKLPSSRQWRAAFLVTVALIGSVKVYDAWIAHRRHDQVAVEVSRVLLTRIPEHSRVLPIFDLDEPAPRLDYLVHRFANYVVSERNSYNPHIFARTGQQPLRHADREEYRLLKTKDVSDEEWAYYDYLIVQSRHKPPRVPDLATRTRHLASAADFHLYAIDKE